MRVVLCGRNLVSFHPSWAVAAGGVGVFWPLAWRGSEADLLMVTCTHWQSWFPGVPGVKLFCGEAGIVEVFRLKPGLIVFRRVTGPLGSVLEFVMVEAGVNDFFEFVLGFSVYLNGQRRNLDL